MLVGVLVLTLFLTLGCAATTAASTSDCSATGGIRWAIDGRPGLLRDVGVTFPLPFYHQFLRDFSTLRAGLCFLPFAVGQLLSAPAAPGW